MKEHTVFKCDDEDCQECCEHDDCDDHTCLNCGKSMIEEWSSVAYDRWKDSRYE